MCLRDGKDGENNLSFSSKLKELKGQSKRKLFCFIVLASMCKKYLGR